MTSSFTRPAYSATQSALEVLFHEYRSDASFAHLRATGARLVPGFGSLHPQVIFIGEAPGVQEEAQRRPFVGAAGALLADLLAGARVLPHECWMTLVVKYRPADNRHPTEAEVDAGRPYLRREVATFATGRACLPPVVLLGQAALSLVSEADISEVRGEVLHAGPWQFLPVIHPASALRNGSACATLRADLTRLKTLTKGT